MFEEEELKLFEEHAKKDKVDLKENKDLSVDNIPAPSKPSQEFLDQNKDKILKTKEDFSFAKFLPDNPTFQPLSKEKKSEVEQENAEIFNGYLLWQSMQPTFKLHVLLETNDETGESTWLEKSFKYHPVTKGQKLRLQLRQARLYDLARRKEELISKPYSTLTNEEKFELTHADALMNIASYKYEELQAKLYFNMNAEDFACINTAEYVWALAAAQYKEAYVPFSKPKP